MSAQQKALRLHIYQDGQSEDRTKLRQERNNILHRISKRLRDLDIQRADSLANDITATDNCRKLFRAARALRVAGPIPSLSVHNTEGQLVGADKGKLDTIREWFKKQFTDPTDETLHAFMGDPRPLKAPIQEAEVEKALK